MRSSASVRVQQSRRCASSIGRKPARIWRQPCRARWRRSRASDRGRGGDRVCARCQPAQRAASGARARAHGDTALRPPVCGDRRRRPPGSLRAPGRAQHFQACRCSARGSRSRSRPMWIRMRPERSRRVSPARSRLPLAAGVRASLAPGEPSQGESAPRSVRRRRFRARRGQPPAQHPGRAPVARQPPFMRAEQNDVSGAARSRTDPPQR